MWACLYLYKHVKYVKAITLEKRYAAYWKKKSVQIEIKYDWHLKMYDLLSVVMGFSFNKIH